MAHTSLDYIIGRPPRYLRPMSRAVGKSANFALLSFNYGGLEQAILHSYRQTLFGEHRFHRIKKYLAKALL